jgi:hypothetical protein
MEAMCSSETSSDFQRITKHENLRSYKYIFNCKIIEM